MAGTAQVVPRDCHASVQQMHERDEAHSDSAKKTVQEYAERFHKIKGELSKQILSFAYRIGLGYTTLAESYDEHNSNLFREIVIEVQTAQRRTAGSLLSTVVKGILHEVKQKLDEIECISMKVVEAVQPKVADLREAMKEELKRSNIYLYDAGGANIVHVAYLCKHYHIGHYLVRRYPDLASLPYEKDISGLVKYIDGSHNEELKGKWKELKKKMHLFSPELDRALEKNMLYTGENILHMTIIRRDYDEVRWLLKFYRDYQHSFDENLLDRLLAADAVGKFFNRRGPFYFGSNPLQFAVCSNSTAIFDLVYSFVSSNSSGDTVGPDVIFSVDEEGNNILHLCVLHGLDSMYEHVHNIAIQVLKHKLHSLYIRVEPDCNPDAVVTLEEEELVKPDCVPPTVPKGFKLREKLLHIPADFSLLDQWADKEARRKVDERLVLALNEDLHSPLTLAASIINKKKDKAEEVDRKVEMLRFLINKMKHKLWEYGPVTMSILYLEGIEIQYNVKEYYQCNGREDYIASKKIHGAICWLCMRDADKAISITEIEKLIQAKWERCGYPLFILSFLINLFLTACVTLILIFINATPSTKSVYSTNLVVDVLYPIVALMYFIMLIQEVSDLVVFRLKFELYYFGIRIDSFRGVAVYDKVLRVTKILAFVSFACCKAVAAYRQQEDERFSRDGASVLYNIHDDQGIKVSMVVCVIASYMHLYYFFMGFDSTGPFVLTMFRIISKDVPYFLNFYGIVVVAFACALSVLSNSHNNLPGYGFLHLVQALWTLIQGTVGINSATHDHITDVSAYPQHLQWLAEILLTAYNTSVIILMLNLLIAMISNTYNAYCEYNDAFLLMAKYNIMQAMEWVMVDSELKVNRMKYAQIEEPKKKETRNETINRAYSMVSNSAPTTGNYSPESQSPDKPNQQDASSIVVVVHRRYKFEMQTVNDAWCGNTAGTADDIAAHRIAEIAQAPGAVTGSAGNKIKTSTTLFIIDPQVDFHPGGSLAVPGADADSKRIADMIDSFGGEHIHDIYVSMDSHHPCHIAHAVSWHKKGQRDERPAPYTKIAHQDIVKGNWVYVNPDPKMQKWVRYYTAALERKGRMILTIWPEHCIMGSKGHSVVPVIDAALQRWALRSERPVNYVMKGQNLRVEMYSALQAEVDDPLDQNTGFNSQLLSMLKSADRLLICGQALSHCVNYTTRDIIEHWDKSMSNIVLLKDGSSSVAGFKAVTNEFLRHCASKQVTVSTIEEAFASCIPKMVNASGAADAMEEGP